MNGRDAVRRLLAFEAGRPLPRGERLSQRVTPANDTLVLCFVRMGGESRPWGLAFGSPGAQPTIASVPEGRDRTLVSEMILAVAPDVLSFMRQPGRAHPLPTDWPDLAPIRQIWLPNSSHLDMLHHLAYAYTF